jgi:hypothetical protein
MLAFLGATANAGEMCAGQDNTKECRAVRDLGIARLHVCKPPAQETKACQDITARWLDAMDAWRKAMANAGKRV